VSRNVSRLLVEAFELRTTACLLGGHVAVSVTGCSQELLVDADRTAPRPPAAPRALRPLSRSSRGTGAPEDDEHARDTAQMARIADGEGS